MTSATARVHVVPSESDAGLSYDVLIGADGNATCTCGDYENRKRYTGEPCKHIKQAKEADVTTMTREVATIKVAPPNSALPTRAELQSMDMIAARMFAAKAVALPTNLKTEADVNAVLLAGWEYGVAPMTAVRHIALVNGKTEPDAQLMAGIVMAKEPDAKFEVIFEDDTTTTVRLTRPTRQIKAEFSYTNAMAQAAGLLNKQGPWTQHRQVMRQWAAIKRLARAYCADLINGISSAMYGPLSAPTQPVEVIDDDVIEGEFATAELLYSEGDDPSAPLEGTYTDVTNEEPAAEQDVNATPSELLNAIGKAHGNTVMLQAREIIKHLYGVEELNKLTNPQRADYVERLRVWLTEPQHEHVPDESLPGLVVCKRCGVKAEAVAPHEHVESFDEERAIKVCEICGIALEGPGAEEDTPADSGSTPAQQGLPV